MIHQRLESAAEHHRAGRLGEAEALYRQIIADRPDCADALHLMGVLALQAGRRELARDLINRAINLQPSVADYHRNLGVAFLADGKSTEAVNCFQQALELRPGFAEAHAGLGQAFLQIGDRGQSVHHLRQAAELAPESVDIIRGFADALLRAGEVDEAIVEYRRLLSRWPGDAVAWNNLGSALRRKKQWGDAQAALRQALTLQPDLSVAFENLAAVLCAAGRYDESIAVCRRRLSLQAESAAILDTYGGALHATNRIDQAIEQYRRAVAVDPSYSQGWNDLGRALAGVGLIDEALRCYDRALALNPISQIAQHDRLNLMFFHPAIDAAAIVAEHRSWNQRFAAPLMPANPAFENDRSPDRRLRIGYCSPNFFRQVQSLLTLPLFSNHDHHHFEIYLYSDLEAEDSITTSLRAKADVWRNTAPMSDQQLADLIRQDKIDVLVDLTLHGTGSRLLAFARKPAPVQMTWLGYPGTTGVDAMDYRLTDPWLDPPGSGESLYCEKSLRLPHSFWCYDANALESEEQPVSPLPAMTSGRVTFGSLNDFRKLNDPVLDLWSKTLSAVAESRVILLAPPGESRRRVLDRFGKNGIDATRIEFVDFQQRGVYMRTYDRIDVALDAFPYNGHATSLDALWMGVPVVTLVGRTAMGRGVWSHLCNLGLRELAAQTPQEFIEIATRLAGDLSRLAPLRQSLRDRMRQSPLTDAPRFARNMESIYHDIWRRWTHG
ncbi:MAG TPA: tetratricopeptide repeat protein [Tepidisphaeraceae bacterium]|nr:tetratricopeptide repeat protein [Tepidisphaeraceae bacterium]